jgi:hypothetical protein
LIVAAAKEPHVRRQEKGESERERHCGAMQCHGRAAFHYRYPFLQHPKNVLARTETSTPSSV